MTDTPKLDRISRDLLEIVCEHVITSRHATLWGKSFDVVGKRNSLEDAIQWFTNEVSLVLRDLDVEIVEPGLGTRLPDTLTHPEWGFDC